MSILLSNLRDRAAKRAAYHRLVRELRRMPRDVALDLNMYVADAERNAAEAIYGH